MEAVLLSYPCSIRVSSVAEKSSSLFPCEGPWLSARTSSWGRCSTGGTMMRRFLARDKRGAWATGRRRIPTEFFQRKELCRNQVSHRRGVPAQHDSHSPGSSDRKARGKTEPQADRDGRSAMSSVDQDLALRRRFIHRQPPASTPMAINPRTAELGSGTELIRPKTPVSSSAPPAVK